MRTNNKPVDSTATFHGGTNRATEPWPNGVCRCGAQRVDSQLGLEATPTLYVENMVALFREVRRVLRDDGTLWLNLGDSYNNRVATKPSSHQAGLGFESEDISRSWVENRALGRTRMSIEDGTLKEKDLVGIPWRVAFALQADGWYLRSDIIWSKPNPMPESVSDRPTKAHEYLFLFSKQPRYFYDSDAIREPHEHPREAGRLTARDRDGAGPDDRRRVFPDGAGRNRRSVWTIPTQPFPEAHFATYPEELVRPCILAGTSEKGECSKCGKPWERVVDKTTEATQNVHNGVYDASSGFGKSGWLPGRQTVETTGWRRPCDCGVEGRPQLVLDPFMGSGTTALVARKHGRRSIGIDLSAEYLAIAAKRTQQLSLLGGVA